MPHAARRILLRPNPRYDRDYGGQAPHASRGTLTPASRSARGFNMIEIAIAMFVVSIGIISMLGVMPLLLKSDRQAIEYTEVAQAAQDFIEATQYTQYTPTYLDACVLASLNTNVNSSAGFYATNLMASTISTNAITGNAFVVNFGGTDQTLLRTMRVIFAWPPNAARQQTNIFITEIAATRDIRCN